MTTSQRKSLLFITCIGTLKAPFDENVGFHFLQNCCSQLSLSRNDSKKSSSLYNSEKLTWWISLISHNLQGYDMYKVEQLSHVQNSILAIWKVSDFAKSMLPISHSWFIRVLYNAVLFAISQVGNMAAKICRVHMYASFLVIIHWKLNVQIHTYFNCRPLLIYYGAILFFLQFV